MSLLESYPNSEPQRTALADPGCCQLQLLPIQATNALHRFYAEEAFSFRVRELAPQALRVLDMQARAGRSSRCALWVECASSLCKRAEQTAMHCVCKHLARLCAPNSHAQRSGCFTKCCSRARQTALVEGANRASGAPWPQDVHFLRAGRQELARRGAPLSEVLAWRPTADSAECLRELAAIHRQGEGGRACAVRQPAGWLSCSSKTASCGGGSLDSR